MMLRNGQWKILSKKSQKFAKIRDISTVCLLRDSKISNLLSFLKTYAGKCLFKGTIQLKAMVKLWPMYWDHFESKLI